MKSKIKHILTLEELSGKEISQLLELSIKLKKDLKKNKAISLVKKQITCNDFSKTLNSNKGQL